MKVAVDMTGIEKLKERLRRLDKVRHVVGEIYIEGGRNQKLRAIHSGGAVLRSGARVDLRTVRASDVATRSRQRVIRRDAGGRAEMGVTYGVLPARNPFFMHVADRDRAHRILRDGVNEIVSGTSDSLVPRMERAAQVIADSMKRNIAPDGRMTSAHVGLHMPAGTMLGEGEKMVRNKPATRAAKVRRFGTERPVLVATGELRSSIRVRTRVE